MRIIGKVCSSIVYRNISVVIAAGILSILFGKSGWWPHKEFNQFLDALYYYVIPLLLAFTGGRVYGGQRGGIISSVALLGLILSSDVPMIIGAIIFSPLIGWAFHKLEKTVKVYFPIGTELLLNNVIDAVLSLSLMFSMYFIVGPIFNKTIAYFSEGMLVFINSNWLPILAFIIEPAKTLFLNNIINHGIVGPLGIQQSKELGKSIFFLLESNPGPGLGMLLACYFKVREEEKPNLKATLGIQLIGGIHEVYFPYVLRRPILLLPVIAGGFIGIFIFQFLNAGLVSTASPASILFILFLAPKSDLLSIVLAISCSTFVSWFLSSLLLKKEITFYDKTETEEMLTEIRHIQALPNKEVKVKEREEKKKVEKVIVACDGGMASSAMGSAILKKKLRSSPLKIDIDYMAVDEIPSDADIIISHQRLSSTIKVQHPEVLYFGLYSLSNAQEYDKIVEYIEEVSGR